MTDLLAPRTDHEGEAADPPSQGYARPAYRDRLTLSAFIVATFLGAALVFFLEPMAVKMLLPAFGGSAAVWNTAMVFFQAALLAGYAYAFALGKSRNLRRTALVHALAVVAVVQFLPPYIDSGAATGTTANPLVGVVVLLLVGIGAPFLVIACAGPLLQRWFAETTHARRNDPYFLYAAGNLGSLAGLLLYPLVVEPRLTLTQQASVLRYGLLAFAVASVLCAATVRSSGRRIAAQVAGNVLSVTWSRRLKWMVLAAAPSALMLGATNHIATDIASFPLLWVIPLGLYLASFVLAFGARSERAERAAIALLPVVAILVAIGAVGAFDQLPGVQMASHWSLLLCAATACHCRLVRDRPPAGLLTTFYLCLSGGGVLGGVLVGILAPLFLDSVIEYPVAIVAAIALGGGFATGRPARISRPLVLGAALVVSGSALLWMPAGLAVPVALALAVTPLVILGMRRAVGAALICAFGFATIHGSLGVVHADRTFYGVHRLIEREDGAHVLKSGTTVHGLQHYGAADEAEPLGYYHRQSPIGEIMRWAAAEPDVTDVSVVGLGAGSLAAYGTPQQHWTFYDVDESIVRTATDSGHFTYMAAAKAPTEIQVADGRLGVADLAPRSLDVLVLDAFTSDAIPVHLLTREALEIYASRLRDDGVMVVHISNRYLELEPILGSTAHAADLQGRAWEDRRASDDAFASHWVLLAKGSDVMDRMGLSSHWTDVSTGGRVWTDDFSDVWGAIRWR